MKKIRFLLCALGILLPAAAGCAPVLIATGAVAGYAASRDSVALDLDRPWEEVWSACSEETRALGQIKREDSRRGRLSARVEDTDVTLTLKQLTPATVRVVIRARRFLLPKSEIAQRLGFAIARRVGN